MDRFDEAKVWANKALSMLAGTSMGAQAIAEGRVIEQIFESVWYCRETDRDHFADGMRKAGIPG
jgi:hypothetical protein